MDELLDLFDVVAALDDVSDLADHADTLLEALDTLDYIDLDVDDLGALDDLAGLGAHEGASVFDWFDQSAVDSFSDASWVPLDAATLTDMAHIEDVAQFVGGELADYPHDLLHGLSGIDYHPDPHPNNPGLLGLWSTDGQSAQINLFDHQESLGETLHHEMGHHLMVTNPDLFEKIVPHMSKSPLLGDLGDFLSGYPAAEQPEEFAAEAFASFKTKPALLQQLDPNLYETVSNWWQRQATVT
jgi:hypothetical protein